MVDASETSTLDDTSRVESQEQTIVDLPVVDLSQPAAAAAALVHACKEFGFFKVVNHGVPFELMARLEAEAVNFFSMPYPEKMRFGPVIPLGYGNKNIGANGDKGWVEYLLFAATSHQSSLMDLLSDLSASDLCSALNDYLAAMKRLGGEVLELMAEGLGIAPRDILSKVVMNEKSDGIFRINHYPPFTAAQGLDCSMTGFGEHTDPQVLSILRSNNSSGLQICLKNESWVSVPPDQESFYMNVGDMLQVLTNGRFRSVKHRVMVNGVTSRVSMIYFFGAQNEEKIAPLGELMGEGEQSLYKEFTWGEYRKASITSRLADNRIAAFEK